MNFDVDDLKELEKHLNLNEISKNDICLVGSATLSLLGIRKHNDLDIVVHSKYNKNLSNHQFIEQVSRPWSTLYSDDDLIENNDLHIIYNGFKFVIPELVYHRKIWHNRPKDRNDIIELTEYANACNTWNREVFANSLPSKSLIKVIYKKISNKFINYLKLFKRYLREQKILNDNCYQMIPTNLLLSKQVLNNKFNRYDLIVRYLAIDSILKKNKTGVDLYNKMQNARKGSIYKNPLKVFKKLIDSVSVNGMDASFPVLVNNDFHIVDGAHRLACALYFNEKYIAVNINKKLSYSPYGIKWFKSNNFSNEELDIIQNKKNEVFRSKYLYFEIVLWPPVANYFDEIEEFIKEKYTVKSSEDYKDISNFTTYIKALYQIDDIKDWKVDLKIQGMSDFQKDIRIIKIEIPEPNFRKKSNGQLISQKVEALKKEVRNIYKDKIENYFHDIIIHIGDNFDHTQQSSRLKIK